MSTTSFEEQNTMSISQMLQHTFSTYAAAYDHAQEKTRCAHISCGVLVNGELILISTNTPQRHAEMEALVNFTQGISEILRPSREEDYFERGRQKCSQPFGGCGRFNCDSFSKKWGVGNGKAMFCVSA